MMHSRGRDKKSVTWLMLMVWSAWRLKRTTMLVAVAEMMEASMPAGLLATPLRLMTCAYTHRRGASGHHVLAFAIHVGSVHSIPGAVNEKQCKASGWVHQRKVFVRKVRKVL